MRILLRFFELLSLIMIANGDCGGTLSFIDSAYGTVLVSVNLPGKLSKCVYSVLNWNGNSVSPVARRISSDCSPAEFRAQDLGLAFGFGTTYEFEYAEFATGVNVDSGSPTCTGSLSKTLSDPTCVTTDVDQVVADPLHVSFRLDATVAREYMTCHFHTSTQDVWGPCTSRFDFAAGYGDVLTYTYELWTGSVLDDHVCTSPIPGTFSYDNPFACPNLAMVALPLGVYAFSVAAAESITVGSCVLYPTLAGGATFPCDSSKMMDFGDLKTLVDNSIVPGGLLNVQYRYTLGEFECTGDLDGGIDFLNTPVSATAVAATTTSVTVTVGTLNSYISTLVQSCLVVVDSCDTGSAPSSTAIGCSTDATVEVVGFTAGANCFLHVEYWNNIPTLITFTDSVSVAVAIVPEEVSGISVELVGECVQVTWTAPASSGGSRVTCYLVDLGFDAANYVSVDDDECTDSSLYRLVCDVVTGVSYSFRVRAVNRIGNGSAATLNDVYLVNLLAAPTTDYVGGLSPVALSVNNAIPASFSLTPPNTYSGRIYVGRLVNAGTLDASKTLIVETIPGGGPIAVNSVPAFTVVAVWQSGDSTYKLTAPSVITTAGTYSLAAYSLEAGGLFGQYWSNPTFSGTPQYELKSFEINFDWDRWSPIFSYGNDIPVWDQVSIRWSGFVSVDYDEDYTFFVESFDYVRLFVNDVLIINLWTGATCDGACSGTAAGLSTSQQYHHVRLETRISRISGGYMRRCKMSFRWASPSVLGPRFLSGNAYKGSLIESGSALLTVTVVHSSVALANTEIVSLPSDPHVAGTEYRIDIQTKDQFGNIVLGDTGQTFTATFAGSPTSASDGNGAYHIVFTPAVTGTFSLSVSSGITTVLQPVDIHVVPSGIPNDVASVSLVTTTPVAGTDLVIKFSVVDSDGYAFQGALVDLEGTIALKSGDWRVVADSVVPHDESLIRANRFGSLWDFTFVENELTESTFVLAAPSLAWNSGSGYYELTLRVPHAGKYDFTLGVTGGEVAIAHTNFFSVVAQAIYEPSASVVITASFPPTNLQVAVATDIVVQLRDFYLNSIPATPTGSPVVTYSLSRSGAAIACSSVTSIGQSTCSLTPSVSGTGQYLSILVDGKHASYTSGGALVKETRGPWLVDVAVAAVDAQSCTMSGIRSTYIAGIGQPAYIVLRDSAGNKLGALPQDQSAGVSVTIDDVQLTLDTPVWLADGTIRIRITPTAVVTDESIVVTLGGTQVVQNSYTVSVTPGLVTPGNSPCDASWSVTPTTDLDGALLFETSTEYTIACTPTDAFDNTVPLRSGLYTESVCVPEDAGTTTTADASYDTGIYTYSVTLSGANNVFNCYLLMGRPGGLIAQYKNAPAGAILDVDGTTTSPVQEQRDIPFVYTKIDKYVSMSTTSGFYLGDTPIPQILWEGIIQFPSTADYTFEVVAENCNIYVEIAGSPVLNEVYTTSDSRQSSASSFTMTDFRTIQITYTPSGATTSISFNWKYTSGDPMGGSTFWVVPPTALFAPLLTTKATDRVSAVADADINPSTVDLADAPNLSESTSYDMTITLKTGTGSDMSACEEVCPNTGSLYGCLFDVYTSGGTSTVSVAGTISCVAPNIYTIPVSFTAGSNNVYVNLILSGSTPVMNSGNGIAVNVT